MTFLSRMSALRRSSVARRNYGSPLRTFGIRRPFVVPHGGGLGRIEAVGCRAVHYLVKGIFSREGIKRRFDRAIVRRELHPDDVVLELAWPNVQGYRVGDLLPVSTLSFEGIDLPVPREWERYLVQMYGDWKKLPELENRRTHLPLLLRFPDGTSWSSE